MSDKDQKNTVEASAQPDGVAVHVKDAQRSPSAVQERIRARREKAGAPRETAKKHRHWQPGNAPDADPTAQAARIKGKVNWPADPSGMTSVLKKELARSIGRINGMDERLTCFLETLKVAVQYARERVQVQKAVNTERLAQAEARSRVTTEKQISQRMHGIASLENRLEALYDAEDEDLKGLVPMTSAHLSDAKK